MSVPSVVCVCECGAENYVRFGLKMSTYLTGVRDRIMYMQ